LISQRAKDLLLTNAMWIREFVLNHPLYQHDSIVDDQIQYDLMWIIQQISNNEETKSCQLKY
jgi:glutamate--cysteine ligase catalytic subunit